MGADKAIEVGAGHAGSEESLRELRRLKARERQRAWRHANPERYRACRRRWYNKYKDRILAQSRVDKRKKLYGLSAEEYQFLLATQRGVCAICSQKETAILKGTLCDLSVDHDHRTDAVRGLLCSKCNSLLGYASDDPTRLLRALEYLKNGGALRL
jgi:hypothetical protein